MDLILFVDDDADLRDNIKVFLQKEGYEVALAKNGDECLKCLKARIK